MSSAPYITDDKNPSRLRTSPTTKFLGHPYITDDKFAAHDFCRKPYFTDIFPYIADDKPYFTDDNPYITDIEWK